MTFPFLFTTWHSSPTDMKSGIRNFIHPYLLKVEYLESLPGKLRLFSNCLATKSWLVGDQITYPDFHLYEMLDQHKQLKPDCLKEFSNLEAFCARFEKLAAIEKYMKSDRFMAAPLNNKMASFGNK